MSRPVSLLALSLLLPIFIPSSSQAIQLHWISGAMDLTLTEATRCTLVVQADSAEETLPADWRLLWVGEGFSVLPLAVDSSVACLSDTAQVSRVDMPQSAEDKLANRMTAAFCSAGSNARSMAQYVLDLSAGAKGRLKVVALDPNDPDSSAVIQSGEATFNGGIDAPFPLTILRLQSDHASLELRVAIVGTGLATVRAATVTSATLPDIPLEVVTQDDSSLTAVANIPAPLPAASVRVADADGAMASAAIPADPLLELEPPDNAFYVDPDSTMFPKDFTLFYAYTPIGGGIWQSLFHIYYIRACKNTPCQGPDTLTDQWFGHAWSRDLINWNWNIHAFGVSDYAWDHARIMAPSLSFTGTRYYMFYTGVDSVTGNQTIGFASTDNLDTLDLPNHWLREADPVLTPEGAGWIKTDEAWQFRDPFVMPDPENPLHRFLMFFTARETTYYAPDPHYFYAVGFARSEENDISSWTHGGYYRSTDYDHTHVKLLESPHVFPDAGHVLWSQGNEAYWRIMYTDGAWDNWTRAILFTTKRAFDFSTPLTDLEPGHWDEQPTALYTYLQLTPESVEYGHQASEVMRFGNAWYWGAYDGKDLRFRKVVWVEPARIHFDLANVDLVGVGKDVAPEVARFGLVELVPGGGRARFRVELGGRMRGTVAIYDVMGRRVRTLLDGELSPGVSIVSWDGRSRHGLGVGSGVYFARLAVGGRSYVLRVPLLR